MAMAAQGSKIWSASGADVYYSPSSFGWVSGYPSDYCGFAKTRVVPYVKGRYLSMNPDLLRKMVIVITSIFLKYEKNLGLVSM